MVDTDLLTTEAIISTYSLFYFNHECDCRENGSATWFIFGNIFQKYDLGIFSGQKILWQRIERQPPSSKNVLNMQISSYLFHKSGFNETIKVALWKWKIFYFTAILTKHCTN